MKVIKKSFGIIMTLSVICLVLLIVGVVFLTKDNQKTFTKNGYIISYKSGNTEVYNFIEGEEYKHNVNGDLVFKTNDDEKVVAALDNFIHYSTGDTAFLQNGVILNLENATDTVVPYYNITDKSLVEHTEGKYFIKNATGDLALNSWIGKISDNKYIFAAKNLSAKLSGSSDIMISTAEGSFFEVTYEENGVVIVSDGKNTRSTTAEKSYIYIGENITISLGDKYIYVNNEPKLSLSQMTINGNENIEIIPPEEAKDEEDKNEDKEENDNLDGIGENAAGESGGNGNDGAGTGNEEQGNDNAADDEQNDSNQTEGENGEGTPGDENNGNGTTSGGNNNESEEPKEDEKEEEVPVIAKNPIFRVIETEIGINKAYYKFELTDESDVIKDNLIASIIDIKTSKTMHTVEIPVSQIADTTSVFEVSTPDGVLSPKTRYLITITGEYKTEDVNISTQYLQRSFTTESLDLELVKHHVTSNRVAFTVESGEKSGISGYTISIYDNINELVESKTFKLNENGTPYEEGFNYLYFENLNSNSEYKIVLNNIKYNGIMYIDEGEEEGDYREDGDYTVTLGLKTLKKKPTLSEPTAIVNKEMTKVTFDMGEVTDENKTIMEYRYYVFESNATEEEKRKVEPIVKKDTTPITVDIDGQKLLSGKSYSYEVVAVYHDGEKEGEVNGGKSNPFMAGIAPSVAFELNKDESSFNSIKGKIIISDDFCTIPMQGRTCFNQNNSIYVKYYETDSESVEFRTIKLDTASLANNGLIYEFDVNGLKAGTNYKIELFGGIDLKDGGGLKTCDDEMYNAGQCVQIGGSMTASTNEIVPIEVVWGEEIISNEEHVFSLGGNIMKSVENSKAEAEALSNLTINVYSSNTGNIEDIDFSKSCAINPDCVKSITKQSNLKSEFFDNKFTISSTGTFGLNINQLKSMMPDNILPKYYIFEITNTTDEAGVNTIPIKEGTNTYVFEVDKNLRADNILKEAEIKVTVKKVNEVDSKVEILAEYDAENMERLFPNAKFYMHMGLCNMATEECYDMPQQQLTLRDANANIINQYSKTFNLKNGTDYYVEDALTDGNGEITLYRGVEYQARYYITVYENEDDTIDYFYPGRINKKYVTSESFIGEKKKPIFYLSTENSTEDTITYSYKVTDTDSLIYKEQDAENYSLYYSVGEKEFEVPLTFNSAQYIEFTIEGLENNKPYNIYYKTAPTKTNTPEKDITVGYETKYTFDGFYDLDDYGLKYTLENNETSNKITVKILDTPETRQIINRISTFNLQILANNSLFRDRYYSDLKDCEQGSTCLKYIDFYYTEIEDKPNETLTVKLYGLYDSGIIGQKSDYGYLIQQNSNELGQGKYLLLNTGKNIVPSELPKDIYNYTGNISSFMLYNMVVYNKLYAGETSDIKKSITTTRSNEGSKLGEYTINFKKVDKKEIKIDESSNNTFKFYSITPDVEPSNNPIINGADIILNTPSITEKVLTSNFIADEEDGKYYYYVELYNEDESQKLDTKKVEVSTSGKTEFTFENLDDNTKYIYKVFAYLDKNGKTYVQLNDTNICGTGTCAPTSYEFNTLEGSQLFGGMQISHSAESTEATETTESVYLNRKLNLNLTLNPEIVNVLKNYDLIVNLIEKGEIVDTINIVNEELANNLKLDFDITKYDTIFGSKYFEVQLIAQTTTTTGLKDVEFYKEFITLNELNAPTITGSKSAHTEVVDDTYIYSLEYDIAIVDNDKVIPNGYYNVRLLDSYGAVVSEIKDISVLELQTIKFATKLEEEDKFNVRVDLMPNREYTLEVTFVTYTNNQSLIDEALSNNADANLYVNKKYTYHYSIYTSGEHGVSLGDLEVKAKNKLITMNFFKSANLTNITKMDYSITKEGSASPILVGTYTIGEGMDKVFNAIEGTNNDKYYSFIIDDEMLNLESQTTYMITYQFYIYDEMGEYQQISTGNNSKYITVE